MMIPLCPLWIGISIILASMSSYQICTCRWVKRLVVSWPREFRTIVVVHGHVNKSVDVTSCSETCIHAFSCKHCMPWHPSQSVYTLSFILTWPILWENNASASSKAVASPLPRCLHLMLLSGWHQPQVWLTRPDQSTEYPTVIQAKKLAGIWLDLAAKSC